MLAKGYNPLKNYPKEHLESNFCRNGITDSDGMWCFVKVSYQTANGSSVLPLSIIYNYYNVPVCNMLTPTALPTDSVIPVILRTHANKFALCHPIVICKSHIRAIEFIRLNVVVLPDSAV
jgi:hypothetical protein